MGIPPSIHAFWNAFTLVICHDPSHRFYEAFHFDGNAPSADELAALVRKWRLRDLVSRKWAIRQIVLYQGAKGRRVTHQVPVRSPAAQPLSSH